MFTRWVTVLQTAAFATRQHYRKFFCRLTIHIDLDYESLAKFSYCRDCGAVWYWPGTGYWDLDICDTRYVYHSFRVQ
jgi:hypothetical protein